MKVLQIINSLPALNKLSEEVFPLEQEGEILCFFDNVEKILNEFNSYSDDIDKKEYLNKELDVNIPVIYRKSLKKEYSIKEIGLLRYLLKFN